MLVLAIDLTARLTLNAVAGIATKLTIGRCSYNAPSSDRPTTITVSRLVSAMRWKRRPAGLRLVVVACLRRLASIRMPFSAGTNGAALLPGRMTAARPVTALYTRTTAGLTAGAADRRSDQRGNFALICDDAAP